MWSPGPGYLFDPYGHLVLIGIFIQNVYPNGNRPQKVATRSRVLDRGRRGPSCRIDYDGDIGYAATERIHVYVV